ncbi:MAG: hypothetical protein JW976_15715 [Syntrophaceae bacterium]|nr:hypothetical protein [Syntrophaceae bacterium]
MAFDFLRKTKRKEIMSAPHWLKIEPMGWEMPMIIIIILYSIATALFAMFIVGFLNYPPATSWTKIIVGCIFGCGIYAAALIGIGYISKKKPLILTERGIIGPYFIAIKWNDIKSYKWETFKGPTRMANAPKGGGISLFIRDERVIPHYVDRFGHTVFANMGYFFNQDQITKTDEIFQRLGIGKIKMEEMLGLIDIK